MKSGGGPPHSKTLARWPMTTECAKLLGVRQPSGALGGWDEPFSLGNGLRRDAENGNRDGRAPQQRPGRRSQSQFGLDEWGGVALNLCNMKTTGLILGVLGSLAVSSPAQTNSQIGRASCRERV